MLNNVVIFVNFYVIKYKILSSKEFNPWTKNENIIIIYLSVLKDKNIKIHFS